MNKIFCGDCRFSLDGSLNQYMQLPSSDFDGLLEHLWAAHTSSLEYPVGVFTDRYAYYSSPEANFEKNWAIAVNYLAAAYLPTTMDRTYRCQSGLPTRVLVNSDIAPFITDFTLLQNEVLLSLTALGNTDRNTGSASLKAWKFVMHSKFARELFLKAFEEFLGSST
ncbi:hypothetical protein STEG23_014957 [Scotinomys teguina]